MAETPKLAEEEWPEIRKIKASRNTGWEYFANLVTVKKDLQKTIKKNNRTL